MTTPSLPVIIVASLISGLLGVLVSTWVYGRRDSRRFKVDSLKQFAANRFKPASADFSRVLNELVVVFNDDTEVMDALREFHRVTVSNQGANLRDEALIRLYKAMCGAAKIDVSQFNDSFFMTPFGARE